MAKASEITEKVTIEYAPHEFEPVEMLDFIQLDGFKRAWRRLALTDEDQKVLRLMISMSPARAPIVSGTGGLRKFRFVDPKSNRGKSGGYRVCYAYFSTQGIVLLVRIYAKNQKDNLSRAECNEIKGEIEKFERQLNVSPLH